MRGHQQDQGLRWADVWEATGVPEHEKPSTRSSVATPEDDDEAFYIDLLLNDEDGGEEENGLEIIS